MTHIAGSGTQTFWDVKYRIDFDNNILRASPYKTVVITEEGYTAFGDIPRIVAISRGLNASDIIIDSVIRKQDA
jgi:hypothetical protein